MLIHAPLRRAKFELRPKEVLYIDPFKDHSGLARSEPYSRDFVDLVMRLQQGLELRPDFYRRSIDDTPDELLDTLGIKHLHLGGQKSNVLVFAAEYDDVVILLEINDHKHFETAPVGSLLHSLHHRQMDTLASSMAESAANARKVAERLAARRRRIIEQRTKRRP